MKYNTLDYPVPDHIAEQVRELLEGKRRKLNFSFTTKVNRHVETTCGFCHEDVCSCVDASGWHYEAELEVDEYGQRWATLSTPHDCAEGRRFRDFLDSPTEPEPREEDDEYGQRYQEFLRSESEPEF